MFGTVIIPYSFYCFKNYIHLKLFLCHKKRKPPEKDGYNNIIVRSTTDKSLLLPVLLAILIRKNKSYSMLLKQDSNL